MHAMDTPRKNELLLIFFLFFITYGYFFQGGGWNQNTRICLTRAMIHQHSFRIEPYREDATDPYFPFVNTGDWAFCNGHYYSNKSPGLSLLAVPAFVATESMLHRFTPAGEEQRVLVASYAATLMTVTLCASLLCVLLFQLLRRWEHTPLQALLLTVCFGFGTTAFSYSTTFYCHLPAAGLGFAAFVLTLRLKDPACHRPRLTALGAGAAASWAVLIEPSAVLLLGLLGCFFCTHPVGRRTLALFLAGCVPAGAIQLFYNAACFGSPLASSYQYANRDVMWYVNGSLFGIPTLKRFAQLLVLPHRGLLFYCPVLAMAVPGAVLMLARRRLRTAALLCLGVAAAYILFIACFHAWHGGSAAGPRYLLPSFPFIFLLSVPALRRFPKTFLTLGCISILINLAITVVTNEVPLSVKNPMTEVILPGILKNKISINPVPFAHFENYPHIIKLSDYRQWPLNMNSFNLGETFFPHRLASLLPLVLYWIGWAVLWHMTISGKTVQAHALGRKNAGAQSPHDQP